MTTAPEVLSSAFTDSSTPDRSERLLVAVKNAEGPERHSCCLAHSISYWTFSRSMSATALLLLSSVLFVSNLTHSMARANQPPENAGDSLQISPELTDEQKQKDQPSRSQLISYTAATFSADKQHVVLGSQASVEVRTVPDLQWLETIPTQSEHVHDLSFSSDGQTLLIAGGSPAEAGRVEVIDWKTRTTRNSITCHDDVVYQVSWSDDDRAWATASADGECKVIDSQSFVTKRVFREHSQAVLSLCWLNSSGLMASAGVDQTVRIWNAETGTLTRTLNNHVRTVSRVLRRPNPTRQETEVIATAGEDRTVRFWQPRIGRLMRFAKPDSAPLSMAWSDDAEKLFVGCDDGKIRIVNFSDATILRTIPALNGPIHEVLVVSQPTKILVVGHGGYSLINVPID